MVSCFVRELLDFEIFVPEKLLSGLTHSIY